MGFVMRIQSPRFFVSLLLGAVLILPSFGCTGTEDPEAISCLDRNDCPPDCDCEGSGALDIGACVNGATGLECAGTCTVEQPCPAGKICDQTGLTSGGAIIYECVSQMLGGLGAICQANAVCDPNSTALGAYCCLDAEKCGPNLGQCVGDCSSFSSGTVGGELSDCQDNSECGSGLLCCLVRDEPAACDFDADLFCTCVDLCAGVTCDSDGNDCTTAACDPDAGQCSSTPLADGTACDAEQGTCMDSQCVLGGLEGCAEASQTYQDGDFAASDWTSAELLALSEGTGSIARNETEPSAGNPDAHRQVDITLTATAEQRAVLWISHALHAAVYDPGVSGAICGVRFFLDGTDQFDPLIMHRATFSVFLEQGGTFYWAARRFNVESDSWERDSWTTTTDAFVRIGDSGPESPDFSASGGPIQFGYLNGSSRPITGPGTGTSTSGADNFKVEIFPPAS